LLGRIREHLEYDYERFQKIEQMILEILGLVGYDATAFSKELRKGLAKVLRKIKEASAYAIPLNSQIFSNINKYLLFVIILHYNHINR
jgi:hypothetical protein